MYWSPAAWGKYAPSTVWGECVQSAFPGITPNVQSFRKERVMTRSTRFLGFLILALAAIVPLPRVASSQTTAGTPTFSKDVARIFQAKCQACHRRDSIAPMSLVSYEETRPWARAIRERVITRNMPPWHLDKTVGIQHFANDRSLSEAEINTIVQWVNAGAPQGDPKDMPPPVQWPDDSIWNFAKT